MALRQLAGPLRRAAPAAARAALARARTVSTSGWCGKAEVADALGEPGAAGVGKQGWGQTKIYDVLLSKKKEQDGDPGRWLWCSKDDLVIDAVRKMAKANVGSLLVLDPEKANIGEAELGSTEGDAVVGIVTERDYLTKVVVKGHNSSQIPIADIMTARDKLMTVTPQHSVLDVMKMMIEFNFRHVPVVFQGNYEGMISIRDVVSVMVKEHSEEVGRLHEYIQGSY